MRAAALVVFAWIAVPLHCEAAGWRGDGSGRHPDVSPPSEWAEDKNVAWRTKVGSSYASPVVVGDRVFVTAEPDLLVCVDTVSGKVLWQKCNGIGELPDELRPGPDVRFPSQCGYATPTPCSDGKRVYALFGTGVVAAYDLEGKRLWVTLLGARKKQREPYGRAASPLVVGDRLLVQVNTLQALDAATGKPVWNAQSVEPTFGTPVATTIGDVPVVVTTRGEIVRVSDGKVLASELGTVNCASPIVQDGAVYFIDSIARAVRLSGKAGGRVEVQKLWTARLPGVPYASPVWDDGLIHTVTKDGVYCVLEAATGKIVLSKRLDILPDCSGSLSVAGGRLFLSSDAGVVLVLQPGREYKELRRNELELGSVATPAFSGKRIFLRGGEFLYCVAGQ